MFDLTSTEITIALAAGLTFSCYVGLILMPAWRCYGRLWEKLAASFLTLYILGLMVGAGAVIGLAVVWSYDRYA
ncbi:MAG TPA: hypothetical protein VFQ12_12000 [Thermoleophilaceae bacterium]|nr:hypothetical protein [Thermoleophilaceae bacterium]